MPELVFKDGRYRLKPCGPMQNRIFLLAPVAALIISMGVMLSTLQTPGRGAVPEGPGPFLMVIPVLLVFGVIAASTAAMAKAGEIVIDPSDATVSFYRTFSGRSGRRVRIPFDEIREVVLSVKSTGYPGRGTGRYHVVRLMTVAGEEDLLMLADEAEARRLAQEISGLVGRSLRDLT